MPTENPNERTIMLEADALLSVQDNVMAEAQARGLEMGTHLIMIPRRLGKEHEGMARLTVRFTDGAVRTNSNGVAHVLEMLESGMFAKHDELEAYSAPVAEGGWRSRGEVGDRNTSNPATTTIRMSRVEAGTYVRTFVEAARRNGLVEEQDFNVTHEHLGGMHAGQTLIHFTFTPAAMREKEGKVKLMQQGLSMGSAPQI